MIIRRPDKGSHFYLKDGTPFYQIERADGSGLRSVTVRDAFKAGAYRSVTNVLAVLAKPGLDYWKQEQVVLASLTLPREPGEEEHVFAERVIVDSEAQAKKAAEAGTRLHELAAGWLISGKIPVADETDERALSRGEPTQAELLAPFMAWCNSNLHQDNGLMAPPESVVLNHQVGYAGRLDLPVRFADSSAGLLDIKTQDVKRHEKTDEPKPAFYTEWAMQLAAYSRCVFADGSFVPPFPWRLTSVVIDRLKPGCYIKEWTSPANPQASSEHHYQAFVAAAKVWSYLKGGTPGIDLKKAA